MEPIPSLKVLTLHRSVLHMVT